MGMDTIELVMEVEDEFGISIPGPGERGADPDGGAVARVRVSAAAAAGETVCPSARAFYRFRRALLAQQPLPRRCVRPSSRVGRLLPEECRERWALVAEEVGLAKAYFFGGEAPVRFPAVFTTVRDLERQMTFPVAVGPGGGARGFEERVWERVRAMVRSRRGWGSEEVRPQTHIINDLGMD